MNEKELFDVVETEQVPGAKFEVVQYKSLKGSDNLYVAEKMFLAKQADIHLKMIRVTLEKKRSPDRAGRALFHERRPAFGI